MVSSQTNFSKWHHSSSVVLASDETIRRCTCDSTFWTSKDVLQGQHSKDCRARIEQEMLASEEIVEEPDASLKKREIGEPDINPGGASSLTADTPNRGESEQESSAN